MDRIQVNSEIEITLKIIGGKCKPHILYILIEQGTQRFKDLMIKVNQISQKTLTNQLRELESDGLILRKAFSEIPPRVEYSITEKGKTLFPILELMCEWGEKNKDGRFEIINPQCDNK
ncbi:MAG: winged helix-turn-helix transcriptional regulator [Cetobacterium sp.]|uniref:winged helix-turn-helix transcriptional regulator n=1 Tax=Cetobacterium sp. TaxID=2071632 RepID=UPI003F3CE57B